MTKSKLALPGGSRQVAAHLREKICQGNWIAGERLPSTRALSHEYSLSLPMIQSVLRELEAQHLIQCRPRRRAIITHPTSKDVSALSKKTSIAVVRGLSAGQQASLTEHESRIDLILRFAQQALHGHGLHFVTLFYEGGLEGLEEQVFPKLDALSGDLAGVISCATGSNSAVHGAAKSRGVPWLTINPNRDIQQDNFIAPDFSKAGRVIGDLFASRGCQRLLLTGMSPRLAACNAELFAGLFEGLMVSETPLPELDMLSFECGVEMDFDQAIVRFSDYLSNAPAPDGIVISDDVLAIAILRVLADRGLTVPDDVAVVGATSLQMSAHFSPSLTSLQQPLEEIGRQVSQKMMQMIRTGQHQVPGCKLPCELVVGQSMPVPAAVAAELISDGNNQATGADRESGSTPKANALVT